MATIVVAPRPAMAAAPVIVNPTQWLESLSVSKNTSGERIRVTVVVKHDATASLTGLAIDDNWDTTDNTLSVAPDSVVLQKPSGLFNYSRTSFSFVPPDPTGLDCGFLSGTRRVDRTLRLRAVTSDGQRTAPVNATVHAVENGDCTGVEDYAFLYDQSQSSTSITPGSSVTFSFRGDDADVDSWTGYKWRTRRLNDGSTSGDTEVTFGDCDNCLKSQTVTFNQRGRYVVEAQLRSEGAYEDAGRYFYVGAVDVNTAASSTPLVRLSAPEEINVGQTLTVSAAPVDSDLNGRAQMIEWDANNDGSFERREFAADEPTGLTSTQRTQTISTTGMSHGPVTVRARVTDNGAINGADTIRRTATESVTVYLNGIPNAHPVSLLTNQDSPIEVGFAGQDPDGHPLTFEIANPPSNGALSPVDGNSVIYAPAPGFFGVDTFTYVANDGHGGISAPATVTVEVNAIPLADDILVPVEEDSFVVITLAATDPDGDPLTFSTSAPSHGTLLGDDANPVYQPHENFNGEDQFTYTVSDGRGGFAQAQVVIGVTPVNDAPVVVDPSLTTNEDEALGFVVDATDVDGDTLTFTITDPPAHGTLTGVGPDFVYTPAADYFGPDGFAFVVEDGNGGLASGTATVEVLELPLIETALDAHPVVARVGSGTALPGLRAQLTRSDTAGGLAGRTLAFSIEGEQLCSAVTAADGSASCGGLDASSKALAAGGFDVSFAGDADFASSTAHAVLVD